MILVNKLHCISFVSIHGPLSFQAAVSPPAVVVAPTMTRVVPPATPILGINPASSIQLPPPGLAVPQLPAAATQISVFAAASSAVPTTNGFGPQIASVPPPAVVVPRKMTYSFNYAVFIHIFSYQRFLLRLHHHAPTTPYRLHRCLSISHNLL